MMQDEAGARSRADVDSADEQMRSPTFPIVELRQYTLHHGQRETLIELFEESFIEPQEELGMKVIGTFRDLDRADRFVWLRGFSDMDSRLRGLTSFYSGSVWQAHREAANATMIDSDNVLLLRATRAGAALAAAAARPAAGEGLGEGIILAAIHYLNTSPEDVLTVFEAQVIPRLEELGAAPLGWFVSERLPNNYPRLPVRDGERVLVWFAREPRPGGYSLREAAIRAAEAPLEGFLAGPTEILRLAPTRRSALR